MELSFEFCITLSVTFLSCTRRVSSLYPVFLLPYSPLSSYSINQHISEISLSSCISFASPSTSSPIPFASPDPSPLLGLVFGYHSSTYTLSLSESLVSAPSHFGLDSTRLDSRFACSFLHACFLYLIFSLRKNRITRTC